MPSKYKQQSLQCAYTPVTLEPVLTRLYYVPEFL